MLRILVYCNVDIILFGIIHMVYSLKTTKTPLPHVVSLKSLKFPVEDGCVLID
jgi:hypothetical protein